MLNVELPSGPKPPFPAILSLVHVRLKGASLIQHSTFNIQHYIN